MVHHIHIPVMGICYTADTPIRVAHFGISSVISLVDDGLLEEYRMAYAERLGVDVGCPQSTRIGRIRAYLDFVSEEVNRKFDWIRSLRLGGGNAQFGVGSCSGINDKDRYFLMLPVDSPLREEYEQVCKKTGLNRIASEVALTEKMEVGEIQANIMVSLNHNEAALDAVRGFAASKVKGSLVVSAGINLGVFEEMAKHECFYRRATDERKEGVAPDKKIILKVSDYRSALIQGRYLAKKGLEVYEYRVESGVNCGGHAFFGSKKTMPEILQEFTMQNQSLHEMTCGMIEKYSQSEKCENRAKIVPPPCPSRITAQGGLCTAEEVNQVLRLGADGVGVGTPFLLVPQATSCDAETRALLVAATRADVGISHASPLGVPFMNLKISTAAMKCKEKMERYFSAVKAGNVSEALSEVGSPCRQHYLCRTLPGFSHPVCMASREYVRNRLMEIDSMSDIDDASREKMKREVLERECICRCLGNAGREEILERKPSLHYDTEKVAVARGSKTKREREPITVCPGPNIGYFNREYSLLEMMQHLYGSGPCLTPPDKPHAFKIEAELIAGMS